MWQLRRAGGSQNKSDAGKFKWPRERQNCFLRIVAVLSGVVECPPRAAKQSILAQNISQWLQSILIIEYKIEKSIRGSGIRFFQIDASSSQVDGQRRDQEIFSGGGGGGLYNLYAYLH